MELDGCLKDVFHTCHANADNGNWRSCHTEGSRK
jgi:hypothetical protein